MMKRLLAIGSLVVAAACGGVEEEVPVDETTSGVQGGTVYTPAGAFEAVGVLGTFSGYNCTATLISEFAVLTAAHCVTNGQSVTFSLPNDRGSVTGTAYRHPLFNRETTLGWYSYDFAVIRLDRSIYEEPGVDTVGLEPMPIMEDNLVTGSTGLLYGYGGFGSGCANGADGQARYRSTSITDFNEDWNYQFVYSNISLCGGDSGGPFVFSDNGVWKVAGVNSFNELSNNLSAVKPTYYAYDWIEQKSGAPTNPGNTWGQCVYYDTDVPGAAYLSVQNTNYSTMPAGWNNVVSSVWVKKGFRARIYDSGGFVNLLSTMDGFTGSNCNEYGCFYDLGATGNRASSVRCESALPQSTWGNCVLWDTFGGDYVSVQGNIPVFSGANAFIDNHTTQVWVKAGHQAVVYPRANYQAASWNGKTYWTSVTMRGDNGQHCNSFGCLHDLTGRVAENTIGSIQCN